MAILVITIDEEASGARSTRIFDRSPILIGQDESADLRLVRSYVSARHGVLTFSEAEVSYVDLGSATGSVVDGRTVAPGATAVLRSGSEITLGHLRLVLSRDVPTWREEEPDPFASPLPGVPTQKLTARPTEGTQSGSPALETEKLAGDQHLPPDLPPAPSPGNEPMSEPAPPASRAPELLRVGEIIADKYTIEGLLNIGACGPLYKVRILGNGRALAAHVLTAFVSSPEARECFRTEIPRVAAVSHENLCQVSDAGTDRGIPFLVTEYLRGESLADHVEQTGFIETTAAIDILLGACAGLAAAHVDGLVHGDIRPTSIFLAKQPSTGVIIPKITDLPIASPRRLLPSAASPSRPYLAPEMNAVRNTDRASDPRSDQYQLVRVLCSCLIGYAAHGSSSVSVRMVRRDVTPELDAIIQRALAPRPEDRFPSLTSLGTALWPFASGATKERYRGIFGAAPTAILEPRTT